MEGQGWSIGLQVASLADFRNIGFRELLQLGTFLGTIYGAWKWWRFSKWQIARRLIEHLDNEEKNILECRNAVLENIRYGKPLVLEPKHRLHPEIDGALKEVSRDEPGRAEQRLIAFATALAEDAKVGARYMGNANRQAATALLFSGLIAKKKRADTDAAKISWVDALQHNGEDAHVIRCLAELDHDAQKDNEALRGLLASAALAPNDRRLQAETAELRGQIYQRKGKPLLERNALHQAADQFVALDDNSRAAKAYARAAELELTPQLRMVVVAPNTLRRAYHGFFRAGDRGGAEEIRQRLLNLDQDASSLPNFTEPDVRQPSGFWMRIAIEVSLLFSAAYLFYLTLR